MADNENEITFEYLREVYRRERTSKHLWDGVRSDLYVATATLFKAQRHEYDMELHKDPESIRSDNINSLIVRTKRLFKDIVNIRMDKICKMALRGADKADNNLDCLTKEEKEYYDKILFASQEHLSLINRLYGSASYHIPDISIPPASQVTPAKEKTYIPTPAPVMEDPEEEPLNGSMEVHIDTVPEDGVVMIDHDPDLDEPDVDMVIPDDALDSAMQSDLTPKDSPPAPKPESDGNGNGQQMMVVRILADLPEIAGPDRNYVFHKEDLARLPEIFATVLLNRNLAEKVSISP